MTQAPSTPANPLSALAGSVPPRMAEVGLIASKVAGIFALAVLFVDQSYDGTRGFTLLTVVLVLASLAPVRGAAGVAVAAAGAGLLLFAGSTLTYYATGLVALACGLIACIAVLVFASHQNRTFWAAAGILAGAPLMAFAAIVVIAVTQR